MTGENQNDIPLTVKTSLLDGLTKFAAVMGSLVALGQTTSTWIDGIYKAKAEEEKTQREVQLTDIKEKSALAESYLQLILNRETPIDGRAILFTDVFYNGLNGLDPTVVSPAAKSDESRKAGSLLVWCLRYRQAVLS
jgi:hypothetical protein